MKRIAIVCLVALGLVACSLFVTKPPIPVPGVVTVYAQTLPVTKTLAWDANAAADAVTNYTVKLDGVVVGTPTTPSQAITFAAVGPHTLTVVAVNVWGVSAPATLTVNVVLPAAPANLRIQ